LRRTTARREIIQLAQIPAQVRFSLEFLMAKQRWRNMQARFRDGQQVVSTTYYETCR